MKLESVRRLFVGIVFCLLWYSSILAGYVCLFCPLLPLVFLSPRLYRLVTDFFVYHWQKYPTALLRYIIGCRIVVTGDKLDLRTTNLIIINHRTRTDWIFIWAALYYHSEHVKHFSFHSRIPVKFILKESIRNIPGIGWIMQLCCYLFIRRNWINDQTRISTFLEYYGRLNLYPLNLLLFPEGTDLTSNTKYLSDIYAEKNNLQPLKNVLHPRTTGFVYLVKEMTKRNDLANIYDLTLHYSDKTPQSEMSLLMGHFPTSVSFKFKRHGLTAVPSDEGKLKIFLRELWFEKEQYLESIDDLTLSNKPKICTVSIDLLASLIFWTLLTPLSAILVYKSLFFRFAVLFQTFFLLSLNRFFGNFIQFEAFLAYLRFHERLLFFVFILLFYSFSFYFL